MDINIKWIKKELAVEAVIQGITDGVIDLHPSVQRNENVWPEKMQSSYIKTLTVCNIPFAIYAYSDNRRKNGRLIKHVWDGLQRLSIIYRYVTNTLDCKTLRVTPYKDLKPEIQARILATSVTMIDAGECDEETIAMLFTTMNTNGCPLNDQEIRDSAYRGALTKTVAAISDRHRAALSNVFIPSKINRKTDRKFLLSLLFAIKNKRHMENFKGVDEFVKSHNESFDQEIVDRIEAVLRYYNSLKLPKGSMWRKISHSYTLILELYGMEAFPPVELMREKLIEFQNNIENRQPGDVYSEYAMLCIHHLNQAGNRTRRSQIVGEFFRTALVEQPEEVTA